MSGEKETTVVVVAASNTEEIQRVELAGAFDWHSIGEVRTAVARVVQCGVGDISLAQWNGEEWVVAPEDPAGFTYHDNSNGVHALFRWVRDTSGNDEEDCLRVRRVVYRAATSECVTVELNTPGLSQPMKVCRCEKEVLKVNHDDEGAKTASVEQGSKMKCEIVSGGSTEGVREVLTQTERVPRVEDGSSWAMGMEQEIKSLRSAMEELKVLVQLAGVSAREGAVESATVSDEVGSATLKRLEEAEVRRLDDRGDTVQSRVLERRGSVRTVRHGEVLIRASGVGVGGVLLAMRRSGMMVRGAEGWQDKLGVRLRVRLREGQTVRGWAQEWKWKVMGRSRVPWRCVVSPRVCGGHETVGRHD
jgi:hypothetical protein